MSTVQVNTCVVCVEPRGNQEFGIWDMYDGESSGAYLYLVHTDKTTLESAVDGEDLASEHLETDERSDSEYLDLWEKRVTKAGIKFDRLPDKSLSIYSTLY